MRDSGDDLSHLTNSSFSGVFGDKVVVSAGFIEIWPWRAVAWSVIDKDVTGQKLIPVHRAVMNAINCYQPSLFKRLEMAVLQEFKQAHRWARMLGFSPEGVMSMYDEWGRDYTLYSRVRR